MHFERLRLEPGELSFLCAHPTAETLVYYYTGTKLWWDKAQSLGPTGHRFLVPILLSYTNDRQILYQEIIECLPRSDGFVLAKERAFHTDRGKDFGFFQFGVAWSSMPFLEIVPTQRIEDSFKLVLGK